MNKIKLDAELSQKLNGLNETLEVEKDGQTVGRFVPEEEYQQMRKGFYEWVMSHCTHTEEELDQMAREARLSDGVPLSEIWKQLGVES